MVTETVVSPVIAATVAPVAAETVVAEKLNAPVIAETVAAAVAAQAPSAAAGRAKLLTYQLPGWLIGSIINGDTTY